MTDRISDQGLATQQKEIPGQGTGNRTQNTDHDWCQAELHKFSTQGGDQIVDHAGDPVCSAITRSISSI